jgi:signal transduction histidine kinase
MLESLSARSGYSRPVLALRRWVAVVAVVLALLSVLTSFLDEMPSFHRVVAPIGVTIILAAWIIEVSGVRWPRVLLIAATILPNAWLTLMGHLGAHFLFLMLLVAWVAVVGSRAESVAALALSLATVGVAATVDATYGHVLWSAWVPWGVGILLTWLMGIVLRRQEQLVTDLRVLRAEAEQRSNELASLLDVSRSVASTLETKPLMAAVLDALRSIVDYSSAAILTFENDAKTLNDLNLDWDRLRRDEPVREGDVLWVPLNAGGRLVAVLKMTGQAFGAREERISLAIARQAAVAMENARLHAHERRAAVLEERQRLARELHDSVTQSLYGISLQAEAAVRALADGDVEPAGNNLREIRETTREALNETRLLLFELRPPLLEERGLAAALRTRLQAVESRAGLLTQFTGDNAVRLAPETEQELYRLAQEALNNVLKHAHARCVAVHLIVRSDCLSLEIVDDGVGFDTSLSGGGGFGLRGMRERAERLGGTLHLESRPGSGTRVCVEVPR